MKIKSNSEVTIHPIKIDLNPQILKILEEAGKSCSEEIKKTAPRRKTGTREYADSWTYEVDKNSETVTVYNKGKQASLTHLLEFGHLTKPSPKGYGKGTQHRVPPQEHIRPAYNKSKKEYLEKLKDIKIKVKTK